MTTRLHLLCSASTSSVTSVAFPADEPLDSRGRGSLSKFTGRIPSCDTLLRSPALCAAQTADGLGLDARAEPRLHDCNFGRWAGRSFADVQVEAPEALADWLQNPGAAPHGGESFIDVVVRVGEWMDDLLTAQGSVLAVAHASIIRAAIVHALRIAPEVFRYIDVAPLTRARLSGECGRWTLAALVPVRDER
jgi:broad specificity phosphatase PhoE